MKTWEDIVKERLEGYESPLPEGSLATFRTRREKKQKLTPDRHRPLVWAITAVAAASLAAQFPAQRRVQIRLGVVRESSQPPPCQPGNDDSKDSQHRRYLP